MTERDEPSDAGSPARRWAPLTLVGVAVVFGLVVLWPERSDVWYLNDAAIHRSMVRWAADRIRDGHMPFDGWYPYLSLGASRFHHYQSLPHILTGAASLLGGEATFRWSLYLLLALWPISVYAGGRLLGLGPWPAAAAALLSPLLASSAGLGYEWGSYVWRGSGTWAQLWGMWALPFAWGLCWQAVAKGKRLWLAAAVLGLTICVHLLTGYLALLCVGVFVIVVPREFVRRLARGAAVVAGALLVSAWMVVPLLTDAGWTVNDEFSRGTFYYDSFGAKRILTWFGTGELFDHGRLPVITALVVIGLVVAVVQGRRRETSRVLIGVGLVSMLLFFGRPTLGVVLDVLPGGADLFLRRFISGVHLAGIYFAGLGLVFVVAIVTRLVRRVTDAPRVAIAVASVLGVLLVLPATIERVGYERQGGAWIDEQAAAEASDGLGYEALVQRAQQLGPGRIFSEQRGQTTSRYRIGQVPTFAALLNLQADAVGFTRPTWSLASPAEYRFDIGDPDMRELFGIRYVIWPQERPFPSGTKIAQAGRHVLWASPEVGYLDVVDTIAPVAADRENVGEQTSSILRSGLYAHRFVPTVAFGGRPAAAPTLGPNEMPSEPPGEVLDESADPASGSFEGSVAMTRPGVVLFKVSFDPRWSATVDGEAVDPQMLSPALVGVAVPAGEHEVTLEYRPYPWTGPLMALGLVTIVSMWYAERMSRRRRRRIDDASLPEMQ